MNDQSTKKKKTLCQVDMTISMQKNETIVATTAMHNNKKPKMGCELMKKREITVNRGAVKKGGCLSCVYYLIYVLFGVSVRRFPSNDLCVKMTGIQSRDAIEYNYRHTICVFPQLPVSVETSLVVQSSPSVTWSAPF
eukprot:scaffold2720_cov173-Amphora_coffeaeformis.AAC.6